MNYFGTCRFCGQMDRHRNLVQYGARHNAHDKCLLDAGKSLKSLSTHALGQFRLGTLNAHERGAEFLRVWEERKKGKAAQ